MRQLRPALAARIFEFLAFRYSVLSSGGGASVVVWGPAGPRQRLQGHTARVAGIRPFPVGGLALTWSADATAIVWDTTSGEIVNKLFNPGPVRSAQVFPEGDRVVTRIEDGTSIVWDGDSWLPARIFGGWWALVGPSVAGQRVFGGLEILRGERMLTWGRESPPTVWDTAGSDAICVFRKHSGVVTAARTFPCGDRVATGGIDGRTMVWSASSCDVAHRMLVPGWVLSLAALEDGDTLAISSSFGTTLWSTRSGARLRVLSPSATSAVPFPDGRRLLMFNRQRAMVWDASSGSLRPLRSSADGGVEGAAVAPGGDVVATCGGGVLTVWDAASGAALHSFREADPDRPPASGRTLGGCTVALSVGPALDPQGFGRGLGWRKLAQASAR